jgi:hypothetical protein
MTRHIAETQHLDWAKYGNIDIVVAQLSELFWCLVRADRLLPGDRLLVQLRILAAGCRYQLSQPRSLCTCCTNSLYSISSGSPLLAAEWQLA